MSELLSQYIPATPHPVPKVHFLQLRLYSCLANRFISTSERKGIGSFLVMWVNLESVIQGEVSQKAKNKYSVLKHMCGI